MEASAVKDFFSDMTPTQACTTALIIATDPNIQNTQVREKLSIFAFETVFIISLEYIVRYWSIAHNNNEIYFQSWF